MKKFLLIAAMAVMAIGANADSYKMQKVWQNTDVSTMYLTGSRQGFGMDGKFYINDTQWNGEGEPTIYIYGENGLEGTMPGYANTAITRDEAGNLVVMNNTAFAAHTNDDPWDIGASILVINPTTQETKEYVIPEDAALSGRCDFLGFPKGDLMEDGQIFLTGGTNGTFFSVITIAGGELDKDECYRVSNDLVLATTSTVINYFTDVNGDDALLYVTRNAHMVRIPMDDMSGGARVVLPNKGPSNGGFPFVFDGKEFILYTYKGASDANYLDGIAITEMGAEEPTVFVPATVTAPVNGYQCNWLNAEVDEDGVTIYHYYPGGYIEVWRMTKNVEITSYTVVGPGSIFGSNWDTNDEANNMIEGEDGTYTWTKDNVTLYGNFEFKVVGNHDYAIYEWPMGPNNWIAQVPEEGIYSIEIIFDPEAEDADRIVCNLTKTGDIGPVEHTYTVAGTENLFGSNWNPADEANDMVKGEDGIYTWTKEGVEFDDYATIEFKVVQDHAWDYAWPSSNWWAEVTEPGKYNFVITFDPSADDMNKITFTMTKVEDFKRGDVNNDDAINISDVTELINYLLTGDATNINLDAANCNNDEAINISDVTELINFLLTDTWSN